MTSVSLANTVTEFPSQANSRAAETIIVSASFAALLTTVPSSSNCGVIMLISCILFESLDRKECWLNITCI